MRDCPFCPDKWDDLDVVESPTPNTLIINPLNPVTPGHVLVIHRKHTKDFTEDLGLVQSLMGAAALYVSDHKLQANIITSIGPAATQSVMHTHIHVVPRSEGDGLPLPWSTQCSECHGRPIVARGLCAKCYKQWQRLPGAKKTRWKVVR